MRIKTLTFVSITTVTQVTKWRLRQLVHEITTTVLYLDIVAPPTTSVAPVITHLSIHHTLRHCGIWTTQPTWSIRTTATSWWAISWHSVTGITSETVPSWDEIVAITLWWALISVSNETIRGIDSLIIATCAWIKRCNEMKESKYDRITVKHISPEHIQSSTLTLQSIRKARVTWCRYESND